MQDYFELGVILLRKKLFTQVSAAAAAPAIRPACCRPSHHSSGPWA